MFKSCSISRIFQKITNLCLSGHHQVEGPHVDKVEQLREQLDGKSGVDAALAQ